jgi:predicted alpha-1,6-mannanase (GH76 family)
MRLKMGFAAKLRVASLWVALPPALFFFSACGGMGSAPVLANPSSGVPPTYLQMATDGVATMQTNWYNQQTGLWSTTGWWNSANALTVVILYSKLANSNQYLTDMGNTYADNSSGEFLDGYYDDEGWWALAWIAAYDWTASTPYLNTANQIFADMTTGWDTTCGGGIWWDKGHTYKNAIANELFLSVAANLAKHLPTGAQQATALTWAEQEWTWFSQSGMINSQDLINDGLTSACENNRETTWTYNQGVILGGLSALAAASGNTSLLTNAQTIALAAISNLTDSNGILHDSCEPNNCGGDGPQFKGIFVRNLATLYAAAPQTQYVTFLQKNAQSIWNNDQGPGYQYGLVWSGPYQSATTANAAVQTSAVDCLLAAAEVSGGA